MNQPLPVTVLSGFAGAGKTTLLNHLLNTANLRIAVIVDDLAALGASSAAVRDAATQPHAQENSVEMPNGCVCCTPRDSLLDTIRQLAEAGRFDALVIESSSIAEPLPLAETLTFGDDDGVTLGELAHVDTMVTVVDAHDFLRDYGSDDALADRGLAAGDDDRTLVELLIEQIEFCDVLVVNKADLVAADELAHLRAILASLNPRARQIVSRFGDVPPSDVLGTGRFEFDTTANAAGWLATLEQRDEPAYPRTDSTAGDHGHPHPDSAADDGDHPHADSNAHDPDHPHADSDAGEPGIGSFVYRARRPFHPERFWTLLHDEWQAILRSKGFFWLATRADIAGSLSQAGGVCRHGPAGHWWAAQDRSEWPGDDDALLDEIKADWHGDLNDTSIGDRRQELALIGIGIDPDAWRARFDACLLTDSEYAQGQLAWTRYADPFPAWDVDDHDHDHGDEHSHDHDHSHGHRHTHAHDHGDDDAGTPHRH